VKACKLFPLVNFSIQDFPKVGKALRNPMEKRCTFRTERELFHADTCEPLKRAAASGGLRLEAISRGGYPGTRLPGNELKELCMAGFWNAPGQQDWGLGWHCNEGIEIGYVSAGRLPFGVGEKFLTVEAGELTITRPWQRHRLGKPNVPACHYSWLILDVGVRRPNQAWQWPKWLLLPKSGLDRLTETLRQNEDPVWHGDRRIGECFSRLDEIVARGVDEMNLARLKIMINELVILLAELLESRNPKLDASFSSGDRTVRLFLENLTRRLDEPWTLESMADACGLGRTQFSTLCRKITNLTPISYLSQIRLKNAACMLTTDPQRGVTEIAFCCGFQSSQYFAKAFREHHGLSPSEYRQREASGGGQSTR
jgi:AraC-like DNA-binding protein